MPLFKILLEKGILQPEPVEEIKIEIKEEAKVVEVAVKDEETKVVSKDDEE